MQINKIRLYLFFYNKNVNILIINGPNLNTLGFRNPDVYGDIGMSEFQNIIKDKYPQTDISFYQSNIEGEIVREIQNSKDDYNGIVINAGAFSHTSVAIRDAIEAINIPVIEVHISNIFAREKFRTHSLIGPVCNGCVSGMGLKSYEIAILSILNNL